jgi:hypothetical protein
MNLRGLEGFLSSFILPTSSKVGPRSSGVERLLGKEEVMSSNLIAGSILRFKSEIRELEA